MSLIDTVSQRCLRIAAARWPSDLRGDMACEWAAELYEIRNDGSPFPKRAWMQLRFAVSLAASPPVNDPNRVPKGWTELMPRIGLTLRRFLMLVGVGLLLVIVPSVLEIVSGAWTELLPDPTKTPDAISDATSLLGTVLGIVVALWLGHKLGRGVPLRHGRRFGAVGPGVIVVSSLTIVPVALLSRSAFSDEQYVTGMIVGLAVLLPLGIFVYAQAARGRTRRALGWAAGAGLLALEMLAIPFGAWRIHDGINNQPSPYAGADVAYFDLPNSLLWFPGSLSWNGVAPGGLAEKLELLVMSELSRLVPQLLIFGAFALMYLARSATSEPAVARSAAPDAPAASEWRRPFGLTVIGAGVLSWAAAAALVTPIADRVSGAVDQEPALWAREMRHWAILLACLGLAWALSGRARVLLPSLAFGLAMTATDAAVDRADLSGFGGFLMTAGFAGALAVAGWWIPTKLDNKPLDPHAVHRAGVAIAVLAAYGAPAALSASNLVAVFNGVDGSANPVGSAVVTTVLSIAFVVVAGVAACANRDRAPSRAAAVTIIGVVVAIMAVLGVTTRFGWPFPGVIVSVTLSVPLVVYMTAVMHWDRRERSPKDVLRWIVGGFGVAIVGVLMIYPQLIVGGVLGNVMLSMQRPGLNSDGYITFAGLLTGAVVYAIAVTRITVRGPRREVVPTADGQVTGEAAPALVGV